MLKTVDISTPASMTMAPEATTLAAEGVKKKRRGRPTGSKDKKKRVRGPNKKRPPPPPRTPTPRRTNAAAEETLRRLRRDEREARRELGIDEGLVQDAASIRRQARLVDRAEQLSGRRLTASEARRVREQLDEAIRDTQQQELANRRAVEDLELRQEIAQRSEAQGSAAYMQRRAAERQRRAALRVALESADQAPPPAAPPTPRPRGILSRIRSPRVGPVAPATPPDGGAAGPAAASPIAAATRAEVTDALDARPTPPARRQPFTRSRAEYEERLNRGPAQSTRAQRAAAGLGLEGGMGVPLHHHARTICSEVMKHAEAHGKKAVREHLAKLKDIETDIAKARAYIRSLS